MATYYAQNASAANINTAIWYSAPSGGVLQDWATVVSVDSAAVLVANNRSINVNVNITAGSLRNDAVGGSTAGGSFTVTVTGLTISANIITGSATCLIVTGTLSVTITGNTTGSATANVFGINFSSTGTLNYTGNLTGGTNTNSHALVCSSTCIANINGNITGTGASGNGINWSNSGTLNIINSSMSGSSGYAISMTAGNLNALTNIACNSLAISLGAGVLANINSNLVTTNASSCVLTSGILNLTGNLSNPVSAVALNITGGLVTVTGNVTASSNHCISIGSATLIINGNVTGGAATASNGINITGTFNVTVNGNVVGGSGSLTNSCGILPFTNSIGTATINGTVTGGTVGAGVGNSSSATTIIINGTAIGGPGAPGVYNGFNSTFYVTRAKGNGFGNGSVGLTSQPGVQNASSGLIYVKEIEYGDLGQSPTTGAILLTDLSTNVALFYKGGAAGTKKTLVDSAATADYPSVSDVRSGVVYANGNKVGTSVVPSASNTRLEVAVDNTTGTAVLSQADIIAALTSFASGRLLQCSTVASTGEQIADALTGD